MLTKESFKPRKSVTDRGSWIAPSILRKAEAAGGELAGEPLVDVILDDLPLAGGVGGGTLMGDVSLEEGCGGGPARSRQHGV